MILEIRFPREKKRQSLHSERAALDGTVFAADILGDLGHGFVVRQPLCVLQLVQVVHDPLRSILCHHHKVE